MNLTDLFFTACDLGRTIEKSTLPRLHTLLDTLVRRMGYQETAKERAYRQAAFRIWNRIHAAEIAGHFGLKDLQAFDKAFQLSSREPTPFEDASREYGEANEADFVIVLNKDATVDVTWARSVAPNSASTLTVSELIDILKGYDDDQG